MNYECQIVVALHQVAMLLLCISCWILTTVLGWERQRKCVYVTEAPAVAVNTNEIIPQREPETLPVGISVHVILICSNPFRANPNLNPSLLIFACPSCLFFFLTVFLLSSSYISFPDAGHLGSVCTGTELLVRENGWDDHNRFTTAAHRSLQRGED